MADQSERLLFADMEVRAIIKEEGMRRTKEGADSMMGSLPPPVGGVGQFVTDFASFKQVLPSMGKSARFIGGNLTGAPA